jgi:hypothetical protein
VVKSNLINILYMSIQLMDPVTPEEENAFDDYVERLSLASDVSQLFFRCFCLHTTLAF